MRSRVERLLKVETPWLLQVSEARGLLLSEQKGVTYRWPDGNVDKYEKFVTYSGTSDDGRSFAPMALGYLANGDVVGFVLGGGGPKFFPADDFETTQRRRGWTCSGGESRAAPSLKRV